MLTTKAAPADERRLIGWLRSLGDEDRRTLLAFAEFLAGRTQPAAAPAPSPEPLVLPRPAQESVIAAIRRLTRTYPMIERGPMLDETSLLMSSHVLQGRDAALVIDDLEALFLRHYQAQQKDAHPRLPGAAGTAEANPSGGF